MTAPRRLSELCLEYVRLSHNGNVHRRPVFSLADMDQGPMVGDTESFNRDPARVHLAPNRRQPGALQTPIKYASLQMFPLRRLPMPISTTLIQGAARSSVHAFCQGKGYS